MFTQFPTIKMTWLDVYADNENNEFGYLYNQTMRMMKPVISPDNKKEVVAGIHRTNFRPG